MANIQTDLTKYDWGIFELTVSGASISFMIELIDESHKYEVTMLEADEAVDWIGLYDSHTEAVEDLKKRVIPNFI